MAFTEELKSRLLDISNSSNAEPMAAYMKHKFVFLGIKSPDRKATLKQLIKAHKPLVQGQVNVITQTLYDQKEREYHYCAMELYAQFKKARYQIEDIVFIEYLITKHAHWDSVDFIAKHILGCYLMVHPSEIPYVSHTFSNHENMWLNRSAILFQLGYKSQTNTDLLFNICKQHSYSNAFFIQKAIGWALREYAKVNPNAVINFVAQNQLKPLSKKEALRRL